MRYNHVTADVPMSINPEIDKEERRRKLLNNPEIYNKINAMAAGLANEIGPQSNVLVDLPIGARFKDTQTNKVYIYEAVVQPLKHDDITAMVMELARMPLEELPEMTYMIIAEDLNSNKIFVMDSEVKSKPLQAPHTIICGRDFVKYFAVGKWVLIEKLIKPDYHEITQDEDLTPAPIIGRKHYR